MQGSSGLWDILLLSSGVALTWIAGESGRVLVASGMGGMMRWLTSETRKIRDGVLAVIGGCVTGTYLWPAVLAVMGLQKEPDNIALAAFIAGTIGISFVKIVTAVVEARTKTWAGGNDDQP